MESDGCCRTASDVKMLARTVKKVIWTYHTYILPNSNKGYRMATRIAHNMH